MPLLPSPPFPPRLNHTLTPPPAYISGDIESNHSSTPPPAYISTNGIESNHNRNGSQTHFEISLNHYQVQAVNNHGNQRARANESQSRRLDFATRQDRFLDVVAQMAVWILVYQWIYFIDVVILVCASGIAINLYKNPWNQAQEVGGATLGYALGGSILACVAGLFSLCLLFLTRCCSQRILLEGILLPMYGAAGALIAYGSYITRNNIVCNHPYTLAEVQECFNIMLSDGWRCGIVTVAMCSTIVLVQLVYSAAFGVIWRRMMNA